MKLEYARKLAWSFHHTTGIEWEELFGEACLAGVKAENDPRMDLQRSSADTFIYKKMESDLKDYAKKISRKSIYNVQWDESESEEDEEKNPPWEKIPTNVTPFSKAVLHDDINALSEAAQAAFNALLETPSEFISLGNKKGRGELKRRLRNQGWSWPKIRLAYRELKEVAN